MPTYVALIYGEDADWMDEAHRDQTAEYGEFGRSGGEGHRRRPRTAAHEHGHHRARPGRQGRRRRHQRRAVRRDEGGARRVLRARVRRPRRGDPLGRADPRRLAGVGRGPPGPRHGTRLIHPPDRLAETIRVERGRVLASLTRALGSLDLAEDAVQDAAVAALERWPRDGVPDDPRAWLTVVARNRALDRLRREAKRSGKEATTMDPFGGEPSPLPDSVVRDDQLRLIFTCCHPALALEARVALSLRTLCGSVDGRDRAGAARARGDDGQAPGTGQGARSSVPTSRTVSRPTTSCPIGSLAVLAVVYLVFTEGHTATSGEHLVRFDLCDEAAPARPPAARAAARRSRGRRVCSPCCCSPTPAGRRGSTPGRPRAARRPGPHPLGRCRDRRRRRARRRGPATFRRCAGAVPAAGRHRRLPRDQPRRSRPPTGGDRRALRPAGDAVTSPVVALNRAVAVGERDGPPPGWTWSTRSRASSTSTCGTSARADLLRRLGRGEESGRRLPSRPRAARHRPPSAASSTVDWRKSRLRSDRFPRRSCSRDRHDRPADS